MKTFSVVGPLSLAAALAATAIVAVVPARAQSGAQPGEPLALRKIMKDIGAQMQAITGAIAHEDWPAVEKAAAAIGDHPQVPPPERARVFTFFGAEMAKFKGLDDEIKTRSQKLGEAAARKDGQAVITAFGSLQSGCYDCHREFRGRFLEHFYGRR